uniref:glutathione S-transferase family protein n=1 Tax=Pseudomonas sp. RW407 TaxID=2202894 RepID=UPI0021155A5A|nr:glutathione S-transferase family protein [Pseudomonas sp. RW407]
MALVLYGHPFSSYTQKVLMALYENQTPFEFRCIGPDTPQHAAQWLRLWPLGKFPLLLDGEHKPTPLRKSVPPGWPVPVGR